MIILGSELRLLDPRFPPGPKFAPFMTPLFQQAPKTNLSETSSNQHQGRLAKGVLFAAFLLWSLGLSPQIIDWEENYGGSGSDEANSFQQTDNGGYVVAGVTNSNDGDVSGNADYYDYWVLKLDSSRTIQWESNYGGSDVDEVHSIKQSDDGGYILAGESYSSGGDVGGNHGGNDYWIVKLDDSGNIQWEENYGGSGQDNPHSVQETSDGGYIVAGQSDSADGDVSGNNGKIDYWVVKLDSSGTIEWERNYGGTAPDVAKSIKQTADGSYIVAGSSFSDDGDVSSNKGSFDYWILKLDSLGNIEWEKNYGGSSYDWAESICLTKDGGYIVGGYSQSPDGDVSGNNGLYDYWLVKLDPSGTIDWQRNYGGSEIDEAKSVHQTDNGGYIVAGISKSADGEVSGNNGEEDYWVMKLDDSGNIEWEGNYGGSYSDEARSVHQTEDGRYIVAGESESSDGDISVNNGIYDYWIVKLDTSGSTGISKNSFSPQMRLYPNPTSEKITIKLPNQEKGLKATVRDVTGRKISEEWIGSPSRFRLELGEETGVYIVTLEDAKGRKTVRKVVKE